MLCVIIVIERILGMIMMITLTVIRIEILTLREKNPMGRGPITDTIIIVLEKILTQ
jgi:hypothetical protein